MAYGLYGLNSKVSYLQYQIDTLVPSGGGAGLTTNNIFTASNVFDAGITTDQILVDGATLSIGEPATTTDLIGGTIFSTQTPTCSIDATASSELCNYNTVVNLIAGAVAPTPSLGSVMLVAPIGEASADLKMGSYQLQCNTINGTDTTTDLSIGQNITAGDVNIGAIVGTGDVNIYSQAVFDLPPHVPTPLLGNDAASKGYVDTLIGNYSGAGLNLYLNYSDLSVNVPGAFVLSNAVSTSPTTYTLTTTALGTDTLIASFATIAGFPGITTLPTGLWQMTIYAWVSAVGGSLFYKFKLYKQPTSGAKVLIATSGDSSDVNALTSSTPDAYHMSLSISTPVAMNLSDVLLVEILSTGTGMGGGVNLNTVFEGAYYSFVNTNLSGGTSLLTTDNNWTAINKFNSGVLTNAIDTTATSNTLTLGTVEAGQVNIGKAGISTIINGNLKSSNIDTATAEALAIGGTTATSLAIGKAGVSTTVNGNLKSSNIDTATAGALAIGGTTATSMTLGKVGMTTLNATATNINLETAIGSTSSINILNGGGATTGGSVNIANGATQSTNVNIGSNTSTGVVNILGGIGNSINIGTGTGARTLSIGSSTNVANICGIQINTAQISNTTKITCPEFASSAVGTAVSFYTANQTGTCNFFTSNIRTGDLNIQTASTNPNAINIGSDNSTTTIKGLTTASLATTAISNAISLYTANTTGICNFLTSTARTAALNIQTGAIGSNAVNIGSSSTTLNVGGLLKVNSITTDAVADDMVICNGTTKSGTLSIQALSTLANTIKIGSALTTTIMGGFIGGLVDTLGLSTPIKPNVTSISYNSATGTTFAGSVGQIVSQTLTAMNITSSTLQILTGLNIPLTAGVWYVQCKLVYLNQQAVNITYPRIIANIGSGTTTNLNSDIAIYSDTDVLLKQTGPTGQQRITTFSGIFSTNLPSTNAAVSVECNDPTPALPLRFAGGTTLTAVRLA